MSKNHTFICNMHGDYVVKYAILCINQSDNPEFSCPDPGVWTVVASLYLIRVAQRKRGLVVDYPDPLSSNIPLIGS